MRPRRLVIPGHKIGAAGARILAQSPLADTLEEITLDNCDIGPEGVRALAESPRLAGLRSLGLSRVKLDDRALAALAAGAWTGLAALDLSGTRVHTAAMAALFAGPFGRVGRALTASSTRLGDEALEVIAEQRPAALSYLDLRQSWVRGPGLVKLATAAPELADLFVWTKVGEVGAPEGDVVMEALARHASRLRRLDLDMWVTDRGLTALAANGPGGIEELTLVADRLGDGGLAALARSERMAELRALRLQGQSGGRITGQGVAALAETPFGARLDELKIAHQPVGSRGLVALSRARTVAPRHLALSSCGIGVDGVHALCDAPTSSKLERLDLSGNPIGDAGSALLAASPHLANLRELDLSSAKITAAGRAALEGSSTLRSLRRLGLAYNP